MFGGLKLFPTRWEQACHRNARPTVGGLGSFTYSCDATGSRIQAVEPQGTTTYAIRATNNQIESLSGAQTGTFGYNAHGDTTSDGTKTFSYNLPHQLIQATQGTATLGTCRYDGLARMPSLPSAFS